MMEYIEVLKPIVNIIKEIEYEKVRFKINIGREYLNERKKVYLLSEAGKFTVLLSCIKGNDLHCIYKHNIYPAFVHCSKTLKGRFCCDH